MADDSRAVEVGVLLDRGPDQIGEWLADAAAFDAGGADALWVDCGPEPGLDVMALAAALAVVTFRARLVVVLAQTPETRTVDTIGLLSRGRLELVSNPDADGHWVAVPVPEGREAWWAACAEAAGRGARGVVVPADPRVLDILRNPDDPGERQDLRLAQG